MPKQYKTRPLANTTIPLQTIRIGRWVPNVSYPHHGYLDPAARTTPLVHETSQRQFKHIYERDNEAGTHLRGTILASGSAKKHDHGSESLITRLSKIYQLDNPEALFSDAIQHQDNRTWIESTLKSHGAVYMIIGYQTVQNAHIEGGFEHSKDSSIAFQAPATAAAAVATGLPLPGDAMDPLIEHKGHKSAKIQHSFHSPGEQVVAVQYRRIRFQFFNSGKIGMKNLESKTRWQYTWDMRGQATDTNDVIEANLAYDDVTDEDEEGNGFDDEFDMSSDDKIGNVVEEGKV